MDDRPAPLGVAVRPGGLGSLLASWPGGLLGFGHLGGGCCCTLGLGRRKEKWAGVQPGFTAGIAPGARDQAGLHTALDRGREEVSPGQRPLSSPLDPSALVLASGSPRSHQERRRHECWPLAQGRDPPSPASSRAAPPLRAPFPLATGTSAWASPPHASRSESAEPGASPGPPTPASQDGARGSPTLSGPQHRVPPSSLQAEPQPGRCVRVGVLHTGGRLTRPSEAMAASPLGTEGSPPA